MSLLPPHGAMSHHQSTNGHGGGTARSSLANEVRYRTIKDVTKALQAHFTTSKTPISLSADDRRLLQAFVEDHDADIDYEEASKANQELKYFWDRYVGANPQKHGAFVGVLRELRPAIVNDEDLLE